MIRAAGRVGLWGCAVILALVPSATAAAEDEQEEPVEAPSAPTDELKSGDTAGTSFYKKGNRLQHARIRLELTPLHGFHSGVHERTGDSAVRTNLDYEIPIVDHLTIAPRVIPLMYYHQSGDENVWAGGLGIVFRGYSKGREQRGWFGEVGLHLLGQVGHFEGNTGTFNFMEEAGFGYQFEKGWHVAGKVSHFSNAGFADDNAGVNNFGIGFGYSFKKK